MATHVSKYARLCGCVLRCRSGQMPAHRPQMLLNLSVGPVVNFKHSFTSQFSASDGLFEDSEIDEELFSLVTLIVKGSDEAVLDSYTQFVTRAATILNLDISRRTILQTNFEKKTLLKSPHIFKKHRVQYEVRTHGRMMKLDKLTGATADVFLEYIQRNLPEGVSMNVEQTEMVDVPDYIRPPIQITHETVQKKSSDFASL